MQTRSLAALPGLLTFGIFLFGPFALLSGQSSQQPADNNPALTLRADTRIVLADVTVTDHHGNPVHNLPASDFQIFDNNQPQHIASFEERSSERTTTTNDLPPVLNAVLLDTTNL